MMLSDEIDQSLTDNFDPVSGFGKYDCVYFLKSINCYVCIICLVVKCSSFCS